MNILCALNPSSAGGFGMKCWPRIAEFMRRQGIEYVLLAEHDVPIGEQVRRFLEDHSPESLDAVVGIGGDGTHSMVIQQLLAWLDDGSGRSLPPYAFIPLGTANDIAKSLGFHVGTVFSDRDLERAVSTIAHGADYRMDLGLVNGTPFADGFTIGLDPNILRERNIQRRRWRPLRFLFRGVVGGSLLYTICTGLRIFRQQQLTVDVIVDGHRWYAGPIINLVVNNARVYAGEFEFYHGAYANDGLLDLVVFTGRRDYLRRYVCALRNYPHGLQRLAKRLNRNLQHTQGRKFEIRLSKTENAQIDGEEFPESDAFIVTVRPGVIPIKIPAEPL